MRCTLSKDLRASRYAVAGYGGRGRGRDVRCSAAAIVRATTAAAREQRTRVAALAVASVNGAPVRQGCSWLAVTLFHRRRHGYPQLLVSDDAVVALATIPCRDDLATVLAHHQPEVCALSTDGQLTPAATGTPVQPQLAIPAGAGDSATAASSFLLPLSVIAEPIPTSELEPELSRHCFYLARDTRTDVYVLSSSIIV